MPENLKKISAPIIGILALLYLLNPGLGIFEFIPDNIPGLGNLDEAAAVTVLLAVLKYYGFDLTAWFKKKKD